VGGQRLFSLRKGTRREWTWLVEKAEFRAKELSFITGWIATLVVWVGKAERLAIIRYIV